MVVGNRINIIYVKNKKYKDAFSSYNVEVLNITDERIYYLHLGLHCNRLLSDFNKDFIYEVVSI